MTDSCAFSVDPKLSHKLTQIKKIIRSIKGDSQVQTQKNEVNLQINCPSNVFDLSETEDFLKLQTPEGFQSLSFSKDKNQFFCNLNDYTSNQTEKRFSILNKGE